MSRRDDDDDVTTKCYYRSAQCSEIMTWNVCSNSCRQCQNNFYSLMAYNDKEDDFELSLEDHEDVATILQRVFPQASDEIQAFLINQKQTLMCKDPRSRRWNKDIIKARLAMWIRSPQAYENVKESHMFLLPSGRQLRRYKNCVPQLSGINPKMFDWMFVSAKKK